MSGRKNLPDDFCVLSIRSGQGVFGGQAPNKNTRLPRFIERILISGLSILNHTTATIKKLAENIFSIYFFIIRMNNS